jgi:hypothetical protein
VVAVSLKNIAVKYVGGESDEPAPAAAEPAASTE